MGVASCANSVCHGAVIPHINSNIAHTEYTVWTRKDPHARVYRDLFRKDFIAITRKLGLKEPHLEPTCLACHASNIEPQFQGANSRWTMASAAKPATVAPKNIIARHTDKDATRAKNIANGLFPTDNIIERTRLCLSCHYGTSDHFVTHKIMGAGHPRISFELDTFTELLSLTLFTMTTTPRVNPSTATSRCGRWGRRLQPSQC